MDLHSAQIQGFTNNESFENLFASPVLLDRIKKWATDKDPNDIVVVSPDIGRAKIAAYYAENLRRLPDDESLELAIVHKERSLDSSKVRVSHIIGNVLNKHCVVIDDIIDTAKTLRISGQALLEAGAKSVIAAGTHGILSGDAVENLSGPESPFERIIVTDTIPQHRKLPLIPTLEVVSSTPIFADVIHRIYRNLSVSVMFKIQQVDF